jgi:hypothetical protein
MPLAQKKYFCMLYDGFRVEASETEIQFRTTNRKKRLAIRLVGVGECFHGLGKSNPL